MTQKQKQTLEYIVLYIRDHKKAPTVREMGAHFDLGYSTVIERLKNLERLGKIEIEPYSHRGIRVL
jgi:Mn-dependent DtxR family transcriptional regulator